MYYNNILYSITCHQTKDSIPHKTLSKVDSLKETIACRFNLKVKYIVTKFKWKHNSRWRGWKVTEFYFVLENSLSIA